MINRKFKIALQTFDGTLSKFYNLLETHDWYYTYSDDFQYFENGRWEIQQILNIKNEYGAKFQEMYNKFELHYFTGKTWNNEQSPKPDLPV